MMSSVCTFHYKFIEQNDKHRFILVLCKNLYDNSVLNLENLRYHMEIVLFIGKSLYSGIKCKQIVPVI